MVMTSATVIGAARLVTLTCLLLILTTQSLAAKHSAESRESEANESAEPEGSTLNDSAEREGSAYQRRPGNVNDSAQREGSTLNDSAEREESASQRSNDSYTSKPPDHTTAASAELLAVSKEDFREIVLSDPGEEGAAYIPKLILSIFNTSVPPPPVTEMFAEPNDMSCPPNVTVYVTVKPTLDEILETWYGEFFRTVEEQELYMSALKRRHPIKPSFEHACLHDCYPDKPILPPPRLLEGRARRKRQTIHDLVYHGCCESAYAYTSPDVAYNVIGKPVELVQDTVNATKRQYFLTETCATQDGCLSETCEQPHSFYPAAVVYVNKTAIEVKDQIGIDYIEIVGCCKSIRKNP